MKRAVLIIGVACALSAGCVRVHHDLSRTNWVTERPRARRTPPTAGTPTSRATPPPRGLSPIRNVKILSSIAPAPPRRNAANRALAQKKSVSRVCVPVTWHSEIESFHIML